MRIPIPSGSAFVDIADPVFIPGTPPANLPPTADAGADQVITLPVNFLTLLGRGSDPEGSAVSFKWSQVSGPAANIFSPDSANTEVHDLTEGIYVFRLTVTDDKGSAKTDDKTVTVKKEPVPVPPTKYQGFGSQAVGGSQSAMFVKVSTKAEFEKALGSNRTIIFTNNLKFQGRYDLSKLSYLTIDGGGFDVTIDNNNAGDGISIGANAHHIILTGLRVVNAGNDCINVVENAHDVLIDHCSAYGGRDGNIDIAATSGKNVTVQYCFLGKGNTGWSGCMLVTSQNVSVHHCLFDPANSPGVQERCPFIHANYSPVGSPNCDFRNNIVFNWGRYATGIGYKATMNCVNNYYASNKTGAIDLKADPAGGTDSAYCAGNFQIGGADINKVSNHAEYIISDPYRVETQDAKAAAAIVLAQVGTSIRDEYEQGIIDSIKIV